MAFNAKGFIRSLYDFGFTSLIATKVIKVVYALLVIIYSVGAALLLLVCLASRSAPLVVAGVIFIPVWYLIYLILLRIFMEIIVVFFKLGEDVHAIRHGASETGPSVTAARGPAESERDGSRDGKGTALDAVETGVTMAASAGVVLLIAAAIGGITSVVGGSSASAVTLEPAAQPGADPFTASVAIGPAADFPGNVRAIAVATRKTFPTDPKTHTLIAPGATPGLYGGSGDSHVCKPEQVVTFLARTLRRPRPGPACSASRRAASARMSHR